MVVCVLCSVITKKVYSLCQLVRQSQLVQSTCVLCTHNRNSAYNTYDQNSYFGRSVDFVVVGTWHSGIELYCTVRSVHKQWGQSSTNIGMSVGIAVGYCHVTTGHEVLVQASALQSGAWQSTCSKKRIMEG